jgi:hypothetical protein
MFGRWLPGKEGGADVYARGQAQIVRGIQRRVARAIRQESEEVVDEGGLIADLGVRMLESYTVEEAVRQADSLRRLQLPWPRPDAGLEVFADFAPDEAIADEDDFMGVAPPPLPLTPPELLADEAGDLEAVVPEAQVEVGQFVVSGVAGRRKTLHKKGALLAHPWHPFRQLRGAHRRGSPDARQCLLVPVQAVLSFWRPLGRRRALQ